jgi:hypothetical protein
MRSVDLCKMMFEFASLLLAFQKPYEHHPAFSIAKLAKGRGYTISSHHSTNRFRRCLKFLLKTLRQVLLCFPRLFLHVFKAYIRPRLRPLIYIICGTDVTLSSRTNTHASKPKPSSARLLVRQLTSDSTMAV